MEKLYTSQEVADLLKIKKTTVYELIKRGELSSTKIGKHIRISDIQLSNYLKAADPDRSVPNQSQELSQNPFSLSNMDRSILHQDYLLNTNGLLISGQNSSVIEILRSHLDLRSDGLPMLHSYMNSYNSLYSLYFEKTHLALISLWETQTSPNEFPYIHQFLPGIPIVLIHICDYQEGFYIQKENPLEIHSPDDLSKCKIRLANREKGSSSRILLDTLLSERGIDSLQLDGYKKEHLSHLAIADAIAHNRANVGIGDQTFVQTFPQLEFIPLRTASLDLVYLQNYETHPAFRAITSVIQSKDFQSNLSNLTGYDTRTTGLLYKL